MSTLNALQSIETLHTKVCPSTSQQSVQSCGCMIAITYRLLLADGQTADEMASERIRIGNTPDEPNLDEEFERLQESQTQFWEALKTFEEHAGIEIIDSTADFNDFSSAADFIAACES